MSRFRVVFVGVTFYGSLTTRILGAWNLKLAHFTRQKYLVTAKMEEIQAFYYCLTFFDGATFIWYFFHLPPLASGE